VGAVLLALGCLFVLGSGVLLAAVLLLRTACAITGVEKPNFAKASATVIVTFVILTVAEGIQTAAVRAAYDAAGLPVWEAGVVSFFAALPIDLLIASGLHAALLGLSFGKSVEVWFAHRLIFFTLLLAVGGAVAVVLLASGK
jgi:hypothetical protein